MKQENPAPRPPVAPHILRHPALLWATWILPQALLLALNLDTFGIVRGEMTARQLTQAWTIGAAQALLLAIGAILSVVLLLRGKRYPMWAAATAVLLHAAYLVGATVLVTSSSLLPASVALWIAPSERVLFTQFSLTMPAVLHALFVLVGVPRRQKPREEWVALTSVLVGLPTLWLLLIFKFDSLCGNGPAREILLISSIVITAFAELLALLRVWLLALAASRSRPLLQTILFVVVSLVGPLGGLLLNRAIPFPSDLQFPWVYALTLFNGLILCLPAKRGPQAWRAGLWLARCATIPYTLYFFFLFLPFVPAASLAILWWGAGLLVLTPILLLTAHLLAIADGYTALRAAVPSRRLLPAGALAALLVPALFIGGLFADRLVLRRAIEYVFTAPPRDELHFRGSRVLLRRGLERMDASRKGAHLPILSTLYNRIVFDGLILPEDKHDELGTVFFGRPIRSSRDPGVLHEMLTPRANPPPRLGETTDDVCLDAIQTDFAVERGVVSARVELEMTNRMGRTAEFAMRFEMPPGVLVGGLELLIGDEWVAGRLADRRAAMWVYRMIRDGTQRDPAILTCTSDGLAELRVFPFASRETRRVRLLFLYPEGLDAELRLGEWTVPPASPSSPDAPAFVLPSNGEGIAIILSESRIRSLPSILPQPTVHFLLDGSSNAGWTPAEAIAACIRTAQRLDGADAFSVSVLHHDLIPLTDAPIPRDRIETLTAHRLAPFRGGFFSRRAVEHLLAARDHDRPVILALHRDSPPQTLYTPPGCAVETNGDRIAIRSSPIARLRVGDAVEDCAQDAQGPRLLLFAPSPDAAPHVYDPTAKRFIPLPETTLLDDATRYASGLRAWMRQRHLKEAPASKRRHLEALEAAEEAGVLIPAAALIAVENSAQWEMLDRADKKMRGQPEALAPAIVPEPSSWALLLLAALLLTARHWR